MNLLLFLLGSLSTNVYQLNNDSSIEFVNTYFSRYQSLMPGYQFETANDSQYIINQTINNTAKCMQDCAYNPNCLGLL